MLKLKDLYFPWQIFYFIFLINSSYNNQIFTGGHFFCKLAVLEIMIKSFKDQSEKIITPEKLTEDLTSEPSLRPQQITEFVGQNEVIENLRVYIQAARERKEALDHVLLFGPPGLGKTTLANLISKEMNTNIRMCVYIY